MRLIPLLISFLFSALAFNQDLHLSQFYTNQTNLNPGLAGDYDGTYRFAGNYRNQWREIGSPLNTVFLAFNKRMFFYTDEFSIGVLFNDDQFSGFNQKTNKFFLNGSYTRRIKHHKLSAGIQLGVVTRSTDFTNQTFPNQWIYGAGKFDQTVYNGEVNLGASQAFFDASFGVVWSAQMSRIKPTVGFTVFHFNRPKDTYLTEFTERLRIRKAFFVDLEWQLKNEITIEPKLLYMWTTKAQDLVVGSNFKKHLPSKLIGNIYLGVLMRSGIDRNIDAIIPTMGFNIKKFDIGFSYDINLSELSQYNSAKSSLEWSLIYTFPIYNPSKLSIPCDRY